MEDRSKHLSPAEVLELAQQMEALRAKLVSTGKLTRAEDQTYTALIQRWDTCPESHGRSWAKVAAGEE